MTKSVLCNHAVIRVLPFLNNPKDLDPSYKMDLDFLDCFGREKLHLITEEIGMQTFKRGFIQTYHIENSEAEGKQSSSR